MAEKKVSYWEQLRDPKWQEKRLRIMERDGFACLSCGSKDKTLNVHHMYYERGCAPWEYPDESLQTVCEGCHEFIQRRLKELHRAIGLSDWHQLEFVLGYLRGCKSHDGPGLEVIVDSYEVAQGVAVSWTIPVDRLIASVRDSRISSDDLSDMYVSEKATREGVQNRGG